MTTTNVTAAQARAGLVYPEGYIWSGSTITYSIPDGSAVWASGYGRGEVSNGQYGTLNATQAANFVSAIETWDSYIRPSMNQVSDASPGQIRVAFTDASGIEGNSFVGAYAYSPPPVGGSASASNGDVWLDETLKGSGLAPRSQHFELLLHELGHSLGLKHPFQSPALPTGYDSKIYTVMSYTSADYFYTWTGDSSSFRYSVEGTVAFTPMVLDILAIQEHYGADTQTGAGNTTYAFTDASLNGRQAIYDVNGVDTIDLSALSRGSVIDLRRGAYSDVAYYGVEDQIDDLSASFGEGNRGFITQKMTDPNAPAYEWTKNVGIAFSTDIENVTGSASADDITGNGLANLFDGRGGSDVMRGAGGNDTYMVDAAGDRVLEAANAGSDRVAASVSYVLAASQHIEALSTTNAAGTGAINLTGNERAQTLYGNAGANILDGKGGADTLYGYGGNDTFAFTTALGASNIDRIKEFSAAADTVRLDKTIFSALSVGTLSASAYKDVGDPGAVVDANDRIIYNDDNGALYYDSNGSGAGGRVQFAILDDRPAVLTYADFVVVA